MLAWRDGSHGNTFPKKSLSAIHFSVRSISQRVAQALLGFEAEIPHQQQLLESERSAQQMNLLCA